MEMIWSRFFLQSFLPHVSVSPVADQKEFYGPSINVDSKRFYLKRPENPIAYPIGVQVLILRPHLYSGCVGEVVAVEKFLHRIKIPLKEPIGTMTHMHTESWSDTLELPPL